MNKILVALLTLSATFAASAQAAPAADARKELRDGLRQDVVVGAAIAKARSLGETCKLEIVSLTEATASGADFEAQINCSVPANEYVGGGVVLMINVKGRAFGDFIDNMVIKVDKAG